MFPAPPFIVALHQDWPFAEPWPGCYFAATAFTAERLTAEDYQRLGLTPTASNQKRQAEFLAGRYCAAATLQPLAQPAQVLPRDTESGRPVWPEGLCGSISHSHGWAAAVASHSQDNLSLGLDIERYLDVKRAKRLSKAILTPAELQRATLLTDIEWAQQLTGIFSAKESLFKALNPIVKRYFGFHDAEVIEWNQQGYARLRLLTTLSADYPAQTVFTAQWCVFKQGVATLVRLPALAARLD